MANDNGPEDHQVLPYDSGGHLLELLWLGLGIGTARHARGQKLARAGKQLGIDGDPVRRLSPVELRVLLAGLESHLQDVQRDIARVLAALHAAT